MNKCEFKNLTPFKWFVLENFPFIEADYDALTNWQLYCKLGKEINKIINSQNIVGEQAENLTNAFNNLKNYVDNYFDNLEEVDTELKNDISLINANIKANYYNKEDTDTKLDTKANTSDVYNKTETDEKLESKQDKLIAGTGIEITGENTINNIQGNYSTNEVRIGTWINGKPLYRKTIDCGLLPNNSTITIPTNLTNIIPRKLDGMCYSTTNSNGFAINTYRVDTPNYSISAYFAENNIMLSTTADRSSYYAYVTLEYTKTTD